MTRTAGARAAASASPRRDPDAIARFVERFAGTMDAAGMPRMPARVFGALLATDSGRLTAAELAELLRVSPAAISGAVRYLTQVDLAVREREPGSRRDHYRVRDDTWYEASLKRERILERIADDARAGVELLGADTPAGRRMAETVAFVEFLEGELPVVLERWRERRGDPPG